ncbi:hypothetical protein ALT1644_210056 [Alteromonas macleodii]
MLWVDVRLTMRVQIALGLVAALVLAPVVVAKGNAHHWETSPHRLSALVGTTYTKNWGNAFTLGKMRISPRYEIIAA